MSVPLRFGASAVLALVIATALPPPAAAQPADDEAEEGSESISIPKLVQIAVQKSTTLSVARSNLRLADLGKTIAGGADELQVTAGLNVSKRAEDTIPNARAQVIAATELQTRLGISKRVATGGDFAVSVSSSSQSRRFGEAPDVTAKANVSIASVAVHQPLLRGIGGGARVNQQRAELIADSATLAAMDAGAATIRELVVTYWTLAFAHANLAVRIQSQKVAKEQLDLTQKMFGRGAIPEGAVKAAAYGLALREEATLRAQGELEAASISLRRLAGLEIGPDQVELVPTDKLTPDKRTWELDELLDLAVKRNPRVAAARLGVELADVDVGVLSNAVLPTLDLTVSAGAVGVGSDAGGALSALAGISDYQVSAGLSFAWGIGGAASAAEKSSRVQRATAKRSAKDAERDIVAAVVLAYREIRASQKRVDVAARAIDLAKENFATEQALFRADKSSNVQVFERQAELEEAQLLEVRAAIGYRVAIATIDYLTGEILKRYDVEVVARPDRKAE